MQNRFKNLTLIVCIFRVQHDDWIEKASLKKKNELPSGLGLTEYSLGHNEVSSNFSNCQDSLVDPSSGLG